MKKFKIKVSGNIGLSQISYFKEKYGSLNAELYLDRIIERIAEKEDDSEIVIEIKATEE